MKTPATNQEKTILRVQNVSLINPPAWDLGPFHMGDVIRVTNVALRTARSWVEKSIIIPEVRVLEKAAIIDLQ